MEELCDTLDASRRLHQDHQVSGRRGRSGRKFQSRPGELFGGVRSLSVKHARVRSKTRSMRSRERLAETLSLEYPQNMIWNVSASGGFSCTHR